MKREKVNISHNASLDTRNCHLWQVMETIILCPTLLTTLFRIARVWLVRLMCQSNNRLWTNLMSNRQNPRRQREREHQDQPWRFLSFVLHFVLQGHFPWSLYPKATQSPNSHCYLVFVWSVMLLCRVLPSFSIAEIVFYWVQTIGFHGLMLWSMFWVFSI